MAELRWAKSAVRDLEEICAYIALDSEIYASVFAKKIVENIESLAAFPFSGRIVPEMRNEMIREKIITNYRIIYRLKEDTIEIVRIIHNARQLSELE